jgi:RND superfamily putative drug exporter
MSTFVLRRARWILAATAAFAVAAFALGGPVVSQLKSGASLFQDPHSESVRAFELLQNASGVEPDPGVVAYVPGGALEPVRERIERDPEVARTTTVDRFVFGFFRHGLDVRSQHAATRLRHEFEGDPDVVLGGGPIANQQINAIVRSDLERAELIALPIVLLLSLAVFRGVVAAFLPPLVGVVAIGATLLGLRMVVELMDVSVFALNLITGLGLGLAIDYSLLLVSRYREEIATRGAGPDALRATLATAGRTIVFSSLTVAAAMGSLAVFPLRFLSSMAVGGALVALSAAAVSLVSLTALLCVLGDRVNALSPRRWQSSSTGGGWARLAAAVMRRPGTVAAASGALLVALTLPALGVRVAGIDANALPKAAGARQVADALDARGLRGLASPLNLVLRERPSTGELSRVRSLPGVASITGPQRVGAGIWRVDVAPSHPSPSRETQRLVDRLRVVLPGALIAGQAAAVDDQRESIVAHLPWALGLLALTSFVLLFAFTGSVVLPVKALLMNALTIGSAFGLLVLVFQRGVGVEGLEQTQPVLLGATVFGLSTDYAVFLLSRIKEAHDGGAGNGAAVAAGLERTGRIVTAAALLFCVAIGSFATSRLVFVQELGVGTAAAVAIDASIVRALLVPSLMAILGEWNWWAPPALVRLRGRFVPARGQVGGGP